MKKIVIKQKEIKELEKVTKIIKGALKGASDFSKRDLKKTSEVNIRSFSL